MTKNQLKKELETNYDVTCRYSGNTKTMYIHGRSAQSAALWAREFSNASFNILIHKND